MVLPDASALDQAVEVLTRGKRVAILAGRGANHATDELLDIADKLGAPIIKAALGKACVPDDNPYCMGGNGLIGTLPSQEAIESCDTLLMVGTSFPYIEFLPRPGQAHCVQIDLDPMRIGLRYPIDVGLVGDSRLVLRALSQLVPRREDRRFFQKISGLKQEWEKLMEERGTRQDVPMKPQVVAREIGLRLSDKAIVSSDSGTATTWWMRHIKAKRGQKFSVSGTLASMACGLPYTIAAQVAFPDRQCVGLVGDGAFTMLMGEFVTAVKYKLPIKIIVLKNNVLGQIKWEQMVFLGNPEYGVELEPIDFVGIAKACGGEGYRIENPADCGRILDAAFANGKPTVVEAVVDALEPPMPAKVKPEQAAHFAESLLRGEPYAGKIALTVLSDRVREVI
jgi:pyruvate dehydrogenase (quinone)/pyruvate oxidase